MAASSAEPPPLIRGFLRQARRRAVAGTPATRGPAGRGTAGRARGLSQQAVAASIGISTRLYQDWECGVRPVPVHRVDALADALGVDPAGRDELWYLATGGFPPHGPARPDPDAVRSWTHYLHALPVPALAVDTGWHIEESNPAWRRLFESGGEPLPDNLLRFVLFSPYARRLCGDWETDWAAAYLRQLRLEAETTGHRELRAIIAELPTHPELSALWRTVADRSGLPLHNDGRPTVLRPPAGGRPQHIRVLVSSPAHDPRRRILTFLPTPDPGLTTPAAPGKLAALP